MKSKFTYRPFTLLIGILVAAIVMVTLISGPKTPRHTIKRPALIAEPLPASLVEKVGSGLILR